MKHTDAKEDTLANANSALVQLSKIDEIDDVDFRILQNINQNSFIQHLRTTPGIIELNADDNNRTVDSRLWRSFILGSEIYDIDFEEYDNQTTHISRIDVHSLFEISRFSCCSSSRAEVHFADNRYIVLYAATTSNINELYATIFAARQNATKTKTLAL